ncbi:MAG: VWA domain-containing protein, partial [Candidatus Omnitrophica bacterium]|nr:VWA domain-containing protein [Candidatus Omnitrophota bacterium]
ILLYLLKLKRKKQEVLSVLLWRQSLEDYTANSPFQKLRTNPLMLLQLLLLALLTLAMMRPTLNLEAFRGIDYYVLLDQSASMAATDVAPNRFNVANEKVQDLIRGMGSGDRMMLLTFGHHTTLVVPRTENKGELLSALDRLTVQDTATDLSEAMTILKASIGEDTTRSKVFLFSDGAIPESQNLFPPAVETVYEKVGEGGSNVGVTRYSITRPPTEEAEIQAFVELTRTPDRTGSETISLEWNDQTIDAHVFEWGEEQNYSHIFQVPPVEEGVLRVSVDADDDFDTDNSAAAVLKAPEPIRVRVYANGFTPLAKAVNQIPETQVQVLPPKAYSATSEADIHIFDTWAPDVLPNHFDGVFFLGAIPPEEVGLTWGEEVEFPIVLDWNRTHPVTRGAEYRNLQIAKGNRVQLNDEFDVLLESREIPLIYSLERGDQRFLGTTFSLVQSNWTRLYSFPITLTNAVRWLSGGSGRMAEVSVHRTGEAIEIDSKAGQTEMTVIDPTGEEFEVALLPDQRNFFSSTDRSGEYRFVYPNGTEEARWVNLLNGKESSITPVETLAFGEEKIEAQATALAQSREIWPWLALLALGVLVVEWWFYTRQSWV